MSGIEASYDETSGAGGDPVFNGRACVIGLVLGIVCVLVLGRLIYCQIIMGPEYRSEAESQRRNTVPLQAKRGTIYDRDGNVLAMSQLCEDVSCNPQAVSDVSKTARIIAKYLGGDADDYASKLKADSDDEMFVYVKRQANEEDAQDMLTALNKAGLGGIDLTPTMKRVYPHGKVGSQILGIVGVDGNGVSGLELYYDKILSGEDGEELYETGRDGTPIAGASKEVKAPKDGTDIVISLDVNIQEKAEAAIQEGVEQYDAESGSVVVSDPKTGEILAACSTPLFDVTDTSTLNNEATSLKPVSSSFEPGSIFKLLTASIALESGSVDTDSTFTVPAEITVGSDTVTDDDGRTQTMQMDLREILRRSSNVGSALVAQQYVGADTFASGIAKFGIGKKTGVDFPGEVAGIVKTREEYDGASLGSMAFGQSLAMPQIQMVRAVGSIADDGKLHTPHFLISKGGKKVTWKAGGTSISKTTADEVTDMMRTVVSDGTAQAAQIDGYDIAAKTGTGEQADQKSGGYAANSYVSSLIGFANADDPEVLVYVGLNGTPYLASESSAKVFRTIMAEALADRGIGTTTQTGE